jgi:hypothetical protein
MPRDAPLAAAPGARPDVGLLDAPPASFSSAA